MKTLKHKLLSEPNKEVELPEDTPKHVEKFLNMAKSAKNEVILREKMQEDKHFSNMESYLVDELILANYKLRKYKRSGAKYTDLLYVLMGNYDSHMYSKKFEDMQDNLNETRNELWEGARIK